MARRRDVNPTRNDDEEQEGGSFRSVYNWMRIDKTKMPKSPQKLTRTTPGNLSITVTHCGTKGGESAKGRGGCIVFRGLDVCRPD